MPVLPLEGKVLGMIVDPDAEAPSPAAPDAAMVAVYADVVFGYCEGFVPVRALAEKGATDTRPHTPFLEANAELASRLAQQAGWAADAGMALFVVPGTVETPGEARAEHVAATQVVLIDLDHGDIAAKRSHLVQHLGPPTLEVASGGITAEGQRKRHLYWRLTEPAEGEDVARVCRARHMIATKVGGDPAFRSAHQPIRVAGSIHAKSGTRRLVEILRHDPRDHDLGELIEAIIAMPPLEGEAVSDLDFNDTSSAKGAVTELFSRKVREGGLDGTTRFDALSRVIGYWIRRCREGHVTPAQAWDEIVAYNVARIDPPWPEARLAQEAERLWKRDAERNGDLPGGGGGDGDDPSGGGGDGDGPVPVRFTEDALAATFADRHAGTWRYVAAWGQWLMWSGIAWRREDTLQAFDLARRICREAAARAGTTKLKAKLSTAATVSAVERLARSDRRHASTTEIWDRDPWLLNTPRGVIDLRTGAVADHDPLLHMTKTAGASAAGDCPIWLEFLDTVTRGDADLQAYLQRMAGYCLTGITSEHALFFLYGTGANGKSVFANTLAAIMGDYATVAAMDMFMATHGDRHPTDMAGLRGARIVTAIETEQGSRWAESKLKALTGGDKITARFMRQDFFEFTPQFKLLDRRQPQALDPQRRRGDEAAPAHGAVHGHHPCAQARQAAARPAAGRARRHPRLGAQGCLEWQRTGLRPPAAVMAATEDYFEAEDAVGRWIDERCVKGPQHTAESRRPVRGLEGVGGGERRIRRVEETVLRDPEQSRVPEA